MKRKPFDTLFDRLNEPGGLLQVLVGPRQVGKTTLAKQLAESMPDTSIYESADGQSAGTSWIETAWLRARRHTSQPTDHCILILDEIQKVPNWAEMVKRLFDEDRDSRPGLRVLILGSSALLVHRGLTESLAGRFERTWMGHWSWSEMHEGFGTSLPDFVRFGGYPGAAPMQPQPSRWRHYILDSIVETAITRDVLQMTRVDKPALLRAVFELACAYSSRELSYQKMLGQLQDAGNTTTLAHYLDLLHTAGLVRGLQKYSGQLVRRRASSPKLLALDTGLVTAAQGWETIERSDEPERWGQLVETMVGAHLHDAEARGEARLYYWRQGRHEVDFVLERKGSVVAIEVKSGARGAIGGLEEFRRAFPRARTLLVGGGGVPVEEFLSEPAESWLG